MTHVNSQNSGFSETTEGGLPVAGMRRVSDSRLRDRNPRTHTRKQIRQIADSIREFGFTNPILIDGKDTVIAGEGRILAAKQLGVSEVPTIRLDHLTEAQVRAYVIADNRLAERAGWDREILAIELQGLIDLDYSIELTGFDVAEIDLILDGQAEAEAPDRNIDDDVPDKRTTVFEFDKHRAGPC